MPTDIERLVAATFEVLMARPERPTAGRIACITTHLVDSSCDSVRKYLRRMTEPERFASRWHATERTHDCPYYLAKVLKS